jgi:dihydrofolate synthase/folylpolyglutamate synthase
MSVFPRLFALERFGIRLGLDTMRALVAGLDHPERAYPVVLVAGTNGKGSVAAMVERALRAGGRRTGRYTSPHLVRLEERFAIDGAPIATMDLEQVVATMLDLEAAWRAEGRLPAPATFFELTTACAFELFRRAAVDVAVVEVGLGGRFDATNVCEPVATAIVSIAHDHQAQLGDTLEQIAAEKAGIARPGVPMVVGELPAAAAATVEAVCAERDVPLVHAAEGVACLTAAQRDGHLSLHATTATREYGPVVLGLAGDHQAGNALVAIRLLEALDAEGLHVGRDAVERGLADVRWPGRLETIAVGGERVAILDGAHNPAGAAALATHLQHRFPLGVPIVLGISADKDVAGIVAALLPAASGFVVTAFPGPRALPAEALASQVRARTSRPVTVAVPIDAALAAAWAASATIVVAGSLFLVGAVREHLTPWLGGQDPSVRGAAES